MISANVNCDVNKLRELFARGLARGIGAPNGPMCIEAAIALASGEPFNDAPACVAAEDRGWSMRLNDSPGWSSVTARAEALWPVALAQLGTAGTDRSQWFSWLLLGAIRNLLPLPLAGLGLTVWAEHFKKVLVLGQIDEALREAESRVLIQNQQAQAELNRSPWASPAYFNANAYNEAALGVVFIRAAHTRWINGDSQEGVAELLGKAIPQVVGWASHRTWARLAEQGNTPRSRQGLSQFELEQAVAVREREAALANEEVLKTIVAFTVAAYEAVR